MRWRWLLHGSVACHSAVWILLCPACSREQRVFSLPADSLQGFLIVTPLRQAGGPRCVMVNRGWVPTEWKEDAAMRAEGQPTGKVCGALRCEACSAHLQQQRLHCHRVPAMQPCSHATLMLLPPGGLQLWHTNSPSLLIRCAALLPCRCGWRAFYAMARTPAALCHPTSPARVRLRRGGPGRAGLPGSEREQGDWMLAVCRPADAASG